MSQRKLPEAGIMAPPGTAERELLEKFRGRNGGFQVPSRSSYRQHEQWRNDVFMGLKLLEAEGLLVVLQLVPCECHGKCAGQPVAAGCELTPKGERLRRNYRLSAAEASPEIGFTAQLPTHRRDHEYAAARCHRDGRLGARTDRR